MTDQTLAGKTVVVFGASSGMGRATALAVAGAGAHAVIAARSEDALADLERDIVTAGGQATRFAVDATDPEAVNQVASQLQHREPVHAVVNTVGTNIRERAIDALSPESWAKMVAINLTSAFNITHAFVPLFRENGGGLIIHVSSSAARKPDMSGIAYQATKAGLVGLAHGTTEEERANGIRTTVIFPGLTDTPMVLRRPIPTPPEVLAKALQPEDIAAACLFVIGLPARAHVPELVLYPSGL